MKKKFEIKGLRWWIIGLIAIVTLINYIDRWALAVMWPEISKELGLDLNSYAIILNTFMVAYAVGQFVSGHFFDKTGTRLGYVISIFLWSTASMLHSIARGIFSFSFVRAILGLGQAGNWPGAVKSNAEWFPVHERAVAQGIFNAGASVGAVIAPPLLAALFVIFGWKMTFLVIGTFGFIWLIPWLIINKDLPKKHSWISEEEREYIYADQSEPIEVEETQNGGFFSVLKHRESWSVLLGRFFTEPVWFFFMGWLPVYLFDVYGFDIQQIGYFAWIPYVGAAIGSLAGGWFSGYLLQNGHSVNRARKSAVFLGAILMVIGLLITALFVKTPIIFLIVLFVVLFGFQFSIGNIQTIPSDLFQGKSVGTLAGLGGMVGMSSVIILNFLVPAMVKTSWLPVFIMIALFVPFGLISVLFFAKNIRKLGD